MPNTPVQSVQRSTRSGSNASSVSLNDIKTLIDNSRTEVLKSIRSLIDDSKAEILNSVARENDKLQALIQSLNKRLDTLETENDELKKKLEELSSERICADPREDLYREVTERQKRKKYLIVSGIEESTSGTIKDRLEQDTKHVEQLASQLGINNFHPIEIARLGQISHSRPRLLRFKCDSMATKACFLQRSKKLRSSTKHKNVFINPDLTRIQRTHDKALRDELKRRRDNGDLVTIRRGRIVNAHDEQNFQ